MNFKKIYFVPVLILGCMLQAHAQQAFVQQETAKSAVTTDAAFTTLSVTYKQTTRVYLDGLGRPVQTIGVQASPLQRDLIQPVAYDNLGRQTTSYLPYAGQSTDVMGSYRSTAISTDQPAFYNQTSQYIVAKDANPYTQQVFENSPLQRLLNAGMVGNGFQPLALGAHYKTVNYRVNSAAADGNILVWNPNGTFTSGTYYSDNTLSVTDGTDEDGTETLSFADLAGRTILKRQKLSGSNLDTYYIYNNAGMISYIIPPKATALLSANSYSLLTTPLSSLVIYFTYDKHGRMTSKTVPAKGTMYIIYDPLNRPILMQDANLAGANKWNYIKYDAKGRAVSQGIYIDNTYTTPANMQTHITNDISFSTWYESRYGAVTNGGYYTNNVFPATNITPLAYAYYDDYDLNQDGTDDYSYVTQRDGNLTGEASATLAKLKGVPTIVSKATVGSGLSGTWLTTATFYDSRLNPIQVRSNNHLYTGSSLFTDTKTIVPDFMGVPQRSKIVKQTGAGSTVTVYTYLTYDHMYRVTDVSQRYGTTGSQQTIAHYYYNELGQVIKKGLGYVNSSTWLQNLDMRYNIRGQLLSINNSTLSNDGGVTNGETNDLFGMQLLYDQVDSGLGNTAYFNGKLSAVKWMTKDDNSNNTNERSYKYTYDGLNRYTASAYGERTGGTGTFGINVSGFDENITSYDVNGNILALNRNSATGLGASTHTQIDNLTYTYSTTNPNQLASVADAGTSAGFMGGSGTYTYDTNGNLTNEPYKGISNIAYNVLNRTDKISFSSSVNRYIDYTYDAGGNLIRKRQYDNVGGVLTLQNTTDYVDGFVYANNTLSYFPMPEGRVLYNGGAFNQEFVISDQQGNARFSFQNNGSGAILIKQENSFYGFGMAMPVSTVNTLSLLNKRLYNGGSEWQNDYTNLPDYYQTFNRNYDAALGRWIGVDPVAESAVSMTSYQYAGNNPIMFNDPLGDLLPLPGSKEAPNETWNPGYYHRGPLDKDWQNSAVGGGGYDLYHTNPTAYWNAYNSGAIAASGTSIYHAGDGTSADPNTGMSLATFTAFLNGTASFHMNFTTNFWSLSTSNAQANNYGEIRGSVTILEWGYSKPATGSGVSVAAASQGGEGGFWNGFTDSKDRSNFGATSTFMGEAGLLEGGTESLLRLTLRGAQTWADKAYVLNSIKGAARTGAAIGVLSIGATVLEDYNRPQGITWGTGAKSLILGAGVAFPVFGLAYGIVDLGTGLITGKTLTDRIGDGVDAIGH